MLLTTLAVATLMAPPATPSAATLLASGDHGKIAWFEGSFEAALAKAKAENKLIFIDFWTSWCGWCKRLDKDTFADESVAAEMKDILCLSIDAESEAGAPLAKRFSVRGYPALILLGSDGKPEDAIGGYLKPDKFKTEIRRVRSGEGTVSGLRKKLAADPTNQEARNQLIGKLESLGDVDGLKALDPEGKSVPIRRLALQAVAQKINDNFAKTQEVDISLMADFLKEEKNDELLFEGWNFMSQMNLFLSKQAEQKGSAADAKKYEAEHRSALRSAWKYVPKAQLAPFGNSLAWTFYEARANLSDEDKAFALEVAGKVQELSKDDVSAIDTYACCLAMNGKKDEAIQQVQRCIELEPDNPKWKDRLAELKA
jgi:thiol-disulfide isomerase/thioredoxin